MYVIKAFFRTRGSHPLSICASLDRHHNFLPWGWDDEQYVDREPVIYAAVKVHDPSIVADWSSIKDDNGYYPGVRVAAAFAEKTGIAAGMKRPSDLTKGEVAIVFADADRIFER